MNNAQNPQLLFQQAQEAMQQGDLAQASSMLLSLIQSHPQIADAHHLLGVAYYQQGAIQEAATQIASALKLAPKNLQYLNNYALMLNALNLPEDALKHFQQAILLAPKDLDVQLSIANTLFTLTRYEEAAGYYRRLLRILSRRDDIRAALCQCLVEIGNTAHQEGHFKLAEAAFSEAITFNSQDDTYFYNLANAQRELNYPNAALQNYEKALKLNPLDADTHNNLGNVQRELGLLSQAIKSYQQAFKLNPKLHHALVHLVHQKQHICDWTNLESDIQRIRQWVQSEPTAQVSPFAFLSMPTTTADEQQQCASHWVKQRFYKHLKTSLTNSAKEHVIDASIRKPSKKLTIGYLSADFRLHPLAFLITELIERHDKTLFDVLGFSYGVNDKSPERKRLEKAFTQFYDIKEMSEIDSAKKIQALNVDILVDLTGFTQSSRTGIVALKPAFVHINWLGFPGTMGHLDIDAPQTNDAIQKAPSTLTTNSKRVPLFDCLITDSVITPRSQAASYSERCIYLPCYQPNNSQRPLALAPSREACGLPDNAFVFCSFNQTFKLSPTMFALWMQCLNESPDSVLWLLECNLLAKQNLIAEAKRHGVSDTRLIFAPRVSIDAHLARHCHADLFLDTLPYNAHTTCSDALWTGLPILTCMGDTFASRVAASLIQSAGLSDASIQLLVTHDLTQYYENALWLSRNKTTLDAIKIELKEARETSVLFNSAQAVKVLESQYQSVWQDYLINKKSSL